MLLGGEDGGMTMDWLQNLCSGVLVGNVLVLLFINYTYIIILVFRLFVKAAAGHH